MRKFAAMLIGTILLTGTSSAFSADSTSSPSPTASPNAVSTISSQTGSYLVGDKGPGGGFIFYVNKKGFKCGPKFTSSGSPTGGLCHYLEVAPSGWFSGKSNEADPDLAWATKANLYKDVSGIENFQWPPKVIDNWWSDYLKKSMVGIGYKNSVAIVKQGNDTTTAAGAARAYQGGSLNDWYLPTLAELNNFIKWARGVSWKSDSIVVTGGALNSPIYGAETAGLIRAGYWSSNEGTRETVDKAHHVVGNPKYANSFAYLHVNDVDYNINNPAQQLGTAEKVSTARVRPIRAF